jgi:hypothetical protein
MDAVASRNLGAWILLLLSLDWCNVHAKVRRFYMDMLKQNGSDIYSDTGRPKHPHWLSYTGMVSYFILPLLWSCLRLYW